MLANLAVCDFDVTGRRYNQLVDSGHVAQHGVGRQVRNYPAVLAFVWSFGVMIDRFLMYAAARKQSRVFVQASCGRVARRQTRRSDFDRRAQQEEPHRKGCRDRAF